MKPSTVLWIAGAFFAGAAASYFATRAIVEKNAEMTARAAADNVILDVGARRFTEESIAEEIHRAVVGAFPISSGNRVRLERL